MKCFNVKSKMLAFVFFFALTGLANANPDPKKEDLKEVRAQIIELIEKPDFSQVDLDQEESTLHFMINKDNELVVLYVDTKNDYVDSYLKSRLNYKKLEDTHVKGRFAMKITLKNGSI